MCVFLRKWKANQLPGTQGIWFPKWSNADCHSSARCEGEALHTREGLSGALLCGSHASPSCILREYIFVSWLPEALRCPVVLRSYKDLPSPAVSPDIKSVFVLVKLGRLVKIISILISSHPLPTLLLQTGGGWGSKARLQSLLKSLLWENLCSILCCLPPAPRNNVFCYQPPLPLWVSSVFTDIFTTRQYKEYFLVLIPNVTQNKIWLQRSLTS